VSQKLGELRESFDGDGLPERARNHLADLIRDVAQCQQFLGERIEELDMFDRRSAHLSHRLYLEVLRTRMRPFGDGVVRFPRMVRDLGRTLGKEVRLEITGENTQVDRDILDRLETPWRTCSAMPWIMDVNLQTNGGSQGNRLNVSSPSKRDTARVCCWSLCPMTAAVSALSACAEPSFKRN